MSGQIFRAAGAAPDAGAPAGGPDDAGPPPVAAPEAMVISHLRAKTTDTFLYK